jgi:hypothetical protein
MSRKNCDISFMSLGKAASSPLCTAPGLGLGAFQGRGPCGPRLSSTACKTNPHFHAGFRSTGPLRQIVFLNVGCRTERAPVTRLCCVYWGR